MDLFLYFCQVLDLKLLDLKGWILAKSIIHTLILNNDSNIDAK